MADTIDATRELAATAAEAMSAGDAIQRLQELLDNAANSSKDFSTEIGAAGKGVAALSAAAFIFESDAYKLLMQEMERAARLPRFIANEIAGSNLIAGTQLTGQAATLMRDAYDTQARLATEQISFGFDASGNEIRRNMTTLYRDGEEQGRLFYKAAVSESRLYNAAINALGKEGAFEMKETANVVTRGLSLTAADLRHMYEKEFATTGEITGKFVENFGSTVVAAEKLTGISAKALSEDMSRMLSNFNMYGNLSTDQMAMMSANMRKLGVDIVDTEGMMNKFMSFEGAIEAGAKIAALTGAAIDTQKLFRLAGTDQVEFLNEVKRQIDPLREKFDSLPRAGKQALAESFGLKDVSTFMNILNADIDETGRITAESLKALQESAEFRSKLETDLRARDAEGYARALDPSAQLEALKRTKDLTGASEELAKQLESLMNRVAKASTDVAPVFAAAGAEMSRSFGGALGEINKIIDKIGDGTRDFVEAGGVAKIFEVLGSILGTFKDTAENAGILPKSMPPLWQKVLDGIDLFNAGLGDTLDKSKDIVLKRLESLGSVVSLKSDDLNKNLMKLLDPISEAERLLGKTEPPATLGPSPGAAIPAAPAVTAPPVTAPEAAPVPASVTPTTPSAPVPVVSDMKVKIQFDLDTARLENLITAKVIDVIRGQIDIQVPDSKYAKGPYKVVLESA